MSERDEAQIVASKAKIKKLTAEAVRLNRLGTAQARLDLEGIYRRIGQETTYIKNSEYNIALDTRAGR